jgi:ribokinase
VPGFVRLHAPVPTIHVVGSMMIDRVVRVRAVPRAGETMAASSSAVHPGGKGANQAAAAARCGARVRMLGRTGADGAFIRDALREAGVGVRAVRIDDPVSGAATVMVADDGENAIVIAPESNLRVGLADIERFLAKARQGEIVLFQNESGALFDGIAAAAARGLRVWLNAAPADAGLRALKFEKLAGLVVNETEAEVLTGERDPRAALELLARWMPGGTVNVTLGAAGAVAAVGAARYAHRGFVVDAVDTVGCGDAFVGGLLAALAEGRGLAEALAWGNAAGALAAMREGAMPSLADRAEVERVAAFAEGTRLAPRGRLDDEVVDRCPRCGHDTSGRVEGSACTECGAILARNRFRGSWRRHDSRRRARLGLRLVEGGAVASSGSLAFLTALAMGLPGLGVSSASAPFESMTMVVFAITLPVVHISAWVGGAWMLMLGGGPQARGFAVAASLRACLLVLALAAWYLGFAGPVALLLLALLAEAAASPLLLRAARAGGVVSSGRMEARILSAVPILAAIPLLSVPGWFRIEDLRWVLPLWLLSQAWQAVVSARILKRIAVLEGV